jgi:hypothetical protein
MDHFQPSELEIDLYQAERADSVGHNDRGIDTLDLHVGDS